MKGGEGADELEEGARAGGGETPSFWQPARGRLGRESVFRLAQPCLPAGMNPLVRFFLLLDFLFQNNEEKERKRKKICVVSLPNLFLRRISGLQREGERRTASSRGSG